MLSLCPSLPRYVFPRNKEIPTTTVRSSKSGNSCLYTLVSNHWPYSDFTNCLCVRRKTFSPGPGPSSGSHVAFSFHFLSSLLFFHDLDIVAKYRPAIGHSVPRLGLSEVASRFDLGSAMWAGSAGAMSWPWFITSGGRDTCVLVLGALFNSHHLVEEVSVKFLRSKVIMSYN